jgi:MFS family permease
LNGWPLAFLITGAPGLLLALLIWTIPEQPRHRPLHGKIHSTFADLGRRYRRHPAFYITHNLGFAMIMSFVVGLQSWNSTYLTRHFGWHLSDIGYWMGLTQICSALAGLAFHGWAVDRLFSGGRKDAHLLYFAVMCALACPCVVAAYLVHSAVGMLVLYNLAYFLIMAFASVGPAALQISTPAWLRGKASAVYMILMSVVGTILGPVIVASLTDLVFHDEKLLGYSMALFGGATVAIAAILFLLGRAPMRRALLDIV